jgi:hypothetical protein
MQYRRVGPYYFIRSRPFREARVRGYILSQHRLGRPLASIVEDPYLERCGGRRLAWHVICEPETIAALGSDVTAEIRACAGALRPHDATR